MCLRTLRENYVYEFSEPMAQCDAAKYVNSFVEEVAQRVEVMCPHRGYNLYKEHNDDMLSVVVVFDIDEFNATIQP